MPILPLVDLLILMSSGCLLVGSVLKAVALTTHYRPSVMGLAPGDWVIVSMLFLAFALTLAARTWVKINEPRLLALRRREAGAPEEIPEMDDDDPLAVTSLPHEMAGGERR